MQNCISDIKMWMSNNFLKLNDDKTEYLIIGSNTNLNKLSDTPVQVGQNYITPSKSARNIGVIFDCQMSMESHINSICKTGYFNLRNISKIKKYISTDAMKTLINSLVTSRIDHSNSLLYGTPAKHLDKLQKLQNSAARLISGSSYRDHISPVLYELHWLPIVFRIEYKILLLTYKCLNNLIPSYLSDLIYLYKPSRQLRSSEDRYLLVEKKANLVSFGDKAFSVASPKLWNKLPYIIRSSESLPVFKSQLKTFLFKKAFLTSS
ncbi:hypothetical protein SNE40_021678 [Patella caerulea]|uniref:Uncharacterized protein n=1 Tax=Patella caerulea TaxID=87958 RepID=A0AAN8GJ37_PATCE